MRRIELGYLVEIAAQVLGMSRAAVRSSMRIDAAESALAAPFAGFGDYERYPTFNEKAGVLGYRLVRDHPLVDGNKRVALLAMIEFVERNGYLFDDSDQVELGDGMVAAAEGSMKQIEFISWVGYHIKEPARQT